jgi:hypothetical protein
VAREFDWTAGLDALGAGHHLPAIEKLRALMEALGVTGLPLHPTEEAEAVRLEQAAERSLAKAAEIRARAEA